MSDQQSLTVLLLGPFGNELEGAFRQAEGFSVLSTETVGGALSLARTAPVDVVVAELAGLDEWPAAVAAELVEAFADRLPVVLLCASPADWMLLSGRYPIANVTVVDRTTIRETALLELVRGRGVQARARPS